MDWRDNLIQVKDSRFCPPSNNSFSPTNLLASCLLSISKYLQDYQELLHIRLKIARYRKLLQREEHWLGIAKDVQISWIHPKQQQQHCTTEWRDDLTQVKNSRFYPCQIFFFPTNLLAPCSLSILFFFWFCSCHLFHYPLCSYLSLPYFDLSSVSTLFVTSDPALPCLPLCQNHLLMCFFFLPHYHSFPLLVVSNPATSPQNPLVLPWCVTHLSPHTAELSTWALHKTFMFQVFQWWCNCWPFHTNVDQLLPNKDWSECTLRAAVVSFFCLVFCCGLHFFFHIEKIFPSRGFCLLKMKHIKRFQKIFTTSQKKEI